MKNKAHLTEEGLIKIRNIKDGMNKNRDFSTPSVILQSSILAPVFCCKVLAPISRKVLSTRVGGYLGFNKVRKFFSKVVHNGMLHP
jgi:hypothetical protein